MWLICWCLCAITGYYMLRPSSDLSVYLYADVVDMRKSIDGLSALVEQENTRKGTLPFDCVSLLSCPDLLEMYLQMFPTTSHNAETDARMFSLPIKIKTSILIGYTNTAKNGRSIYWHIA